MEVRSKNNLLCYCALLVLVIIVHYFIALKPGIAMQPSQGALFSWPAIGVFGFLGFIGVVLLNLTKIKGLWDTDVGIKQKVIFPIVIGLLLGSILAVYDLLTGVEALVAASMGIESIQIAFPYSIPIYLGGAIIISIIYYLILIPIVVFVVSTKFFKGKAEGVVFWSIGIPIAFIEPLTNPGIKILTQLGAIAIPLFAFSLFFGLLSVLFIRKYGFISAIFLRIGFYVVWHILYGLF